jgi:dolichol-phosphate mannosyltransferase
MIKYSIVLPTRNERGNIVSLISSLQDLPIYINSEIIVVDDDSVDGTAELVKQICQDDHKVRLIRRIGRHGLASAIKEGLLDATGDYAVVMDSDGQHETQSVEAAVSLIQASGSDLVIGSRFVPGASIQGLSSNRKKGSNWANRWARRSLPKTYQHLTDYMSGFFAIRIPTCQQYIRKIDVHGFKFLYELLSVSSSSLDCQEIPLQFKCRNYGDSKLDLAVFWDFLVSLLHNITYRLMPRRAISFGLVGISGVGVQLLANQFLMQWFNLAFNQALPFAVLFAASSNYLINNALTFRSRRLYGANLFLGLIKFWFVASLPVAANVGLASAYFSLVQPNVILSQLAGIAVVFIWNYAASNRLVWNMP